MSEEIHRLVIEHSNRVDVVDTFAVGTILHVPALYWTPDFGDPPTPNYVNHRAIIDATNINIEAFNIEIGAMSAPKLHQSGEKGRKSKRSYMFNLFREEAKQDMMHLNDSKKIAMAMRYVKYFNTATPKAYQLAD